MQIKNYKEFWEKDNLNNIVPKKGEECPEGFNVNEKIKSFLNGVQYSSVVDYGCGYGRLTPAYDGKQYLGVDINKNAVEEAKKNHQGKEFRCISNEDKLVSDLVSFYTVLLHNDDDNVLKILNTLDTKYVFICEILGREWRGGKKVPAYNRTIEDYDKLLQPFKRIKHESYPYTYYSNNPAFRNRNTNISFILYEK